MCRNHLKSVRRDFELITVSREPIDFGDTNIVLNIPRSAESMHAQIMAGLRACTQDQIFFAESDLLYHPSHFEFILPTVSDFWYNEHTYKIDLFSRHTVFYYTKQVSGLCADRRLLLEHYAKRIERIKHEGKFDRRIGYEPGCHRFPRGIDFVRAKRWMSKFPNVDIRHDKNLTLTKHSVSEFRNPKSCIGWKEVDEIPGWGLSKDLWDFPDLVFGGNHA